MINITPTILELYAIDGDLTIEKLPEGDALAVSTTTSGTSTFSCCATLMCL